MVEAFDALFLGNSNGHTRRVCSIITVGASLLPVGAACCLWAPQAPASEPQASEDPSRLVGKRADWSGNEGRFRSRVPRWSETVGSTPEGASRPSVSTCYVTVPPTTQDSPLRSTPLTYGVVDGGGDRARSIPGTDRRAHDSESSCAVDHHGRARGQDDGRSVQRAQHPPRIFA